MSKLLIDESPILVLPSLAQQVGLNEAIFIQQLHYWLKDSSNIKENHKWVYNTYEGWQEQFPFWSVSTLRRIIAKLEKMGLIIIGNYNKLQIDKTKWYRIDYQILKRMSSPSVQNEQSECSEWTDGDTNLNRPLPEITSKIITEIKEVEEDASRENNPFIFFEQNGFGTIGGHISQKINQWCEDLSDELVLEAMKIAVERGAKSWAYVEKILLNWAEKKITSVEQVKALILEFKEKQSKQRIRHYKAKREEKLPDWFDEDDNGNNQIPVSTEINSEMTDVGELLKEFRDRKNNNELAKGSSPDNELQKKKIALEERLKKFRE